MAACFQRAPDLAPATPVDGDGNPAMPPRFCIHDHIPCLALFATVDVEAAGAEFLPSFKVQLPGNARAVAARNLRAGVLARA